MNTLVIYAEISCFFCFHPTKPFSEEQQQPPLSRESYTHSPAHWQSSKLRASPRGNTSRYQATSPCFSVDRLIGVVGWYLYILPSSHPFRLNVSNFRGLLFKGPLFLVFLFGGGKVSNFRTLQVDSLDLQPPTQDDGESVRCGDPQICMINVSCRLSSW